MCVICVHVRAHGGVLLFGLGSIFSWYVIHVYVMCACVLHMYACVLYMCMCELIRVCYSLAWGLIYSRVSRVGEGASRRPHNTPITIIHIQKIKMVKSLWRNVKWDKLLWRIGFPLVPPPCFPIQLVFLYSWSVLRTPGLVHPTPPFRSSTSLTTGIYFQANNIKVQVPLYYIFLQVNVVQYVSVGFLTIR